VSAQPEPYSEEEKGGWKVECISNLEDYTGVVRMSLFDGDDNSNGLLATCKRLQQGHAPPAKSGSGLT
jgi:hypothetical protein